MDLATTANGELAGDVPGALQAIAGAQRDDFDSRDAAAKFAVFFMGLLIAALLIVTIVAKSYGTLYPGIMKAVLDEG